MNQKQFKIYPVKEPFKERLYHKVKESGDIAKYILFAIISLFILSKVIVISVMAKVLPSWLFLNVGNYHIHHYVYGIFLLIMLTTYLLFRNRSLISKASRRIISGIYGVSVALMFDEFAYWLFFKNDYYSKISINSIIFIFCIFLGIWLMPKFKSFRVDTWMEVIIVLFVFICVGIALILAGNGIMESLQGIFAALNASSPK